MGLLSGKTALIIGLGESGYGAALLLKSMGAEVRVTDSNSNEQILNYVKALSGLNVEIELGQHSQNFWQGVDFAILSPGVPHDIPLIQSLRSQGVPVWGEFEWASRFLPGNVIAVTGSNGKSTTSTLIHEILKGAGLRSSLAGNIGRSLSRAIVEDRHSDYWVLEVSSFQLEGVETFKPWISLLLNLTPNHLDHYAGFQDYIQAKLNIFRNQKEDDWAIIHHALNSFVPSRPQVIQIDPSRLPLCGRHFVENTMFASAATRICGVASDVVDHVVQNFRGLEHRQEVVKTAEGILWVNDSKATSVDAVRSALEAFEPPLIWIAGGKYKGGDFRGLKDLISGKVKEAHFFGEAAQLLSNFMKGICPVFTHENLENVFGQVRLKAKSGDTVLFSPGCSSFDQFKNFEERGRFFRHLCNAQLITCSM